MGQSGFIAAMNQALTEVHAALAGDPMGFDHVRLSIIAFSDNTEVLLPLCKVTDVADMPRITESGLTNYGTAFELLQSTIEDDVSSMKGEGFRVYRPLVFFMSNGEPSDNWELAYEGLTNHTFRPHITSFGFECADATILAKIATMGFYVGQDDADAGRALADVMISNLQQINSFELGRNMAMPNIALANWSVKVPPGLTGEGAGKYRHVGRAAPSPIALDPQT
jgi:uncharacterized protein YegL